LPVWAWVVVVVAALIVVAAVVAAVIFGWRAYRRRVLLRLLARAEAVEAAASALVDAATRLAAGSDEELERFADDPDYVERRTLGEVHSRARMLVDELDRMPVPRKLETVAEALADAAFVVAQEASRVGDDVTGPAALENLASTDLALVGAYTKKARVLLVEACEACGLGETAVYGGGLYL
jgi:hypothetical protein